MEHSHLIQRKRDKSEDESERGGLQLLFGLQLNIQKTKIIASSTITSLQVDGETVEKVADFILEGLQNHCRWWPQPWN